MKYFDISFKYNLGKFARFIIYAECRHIFVEFKVSETLENLLESCLADGIVFELMLFLQLLYELEEEADGVIMTL